MEISRSTEQLNCKSEFASLEKVLVCPPTYMSISEVINETQKHYIEENIDENKAIKQHNKFVEKMKEHQIEVISLDPMEKFPEQVFTRDIGFTLGDKVFVSRMGSGVRDGEEELFKGWLEKHEITYEVLQDSSIEGGDVIIDQDTLFVGISGRTSSEVIHTLEKQLPEFQVYPLPIKKSYLHLDCVFNIISPNEALIHSPAFRQKELALLASRYDLIEVSKEEQFTMGTNVLSVGNKKIFSLPCNAQVNNDLRRRGYEVIEVDISEIIKSGGSFRCCTLPVKRQNN
ncbi:dimethylarginine dimethylaminohydrolase family protein [Sutcliffiella deserti]|uniref:dimethylarginine dimethylaminohydrolase family protein n=1 Tax=Sutcliffiella deserti TaxID=2875501 RepID=UPI0021E0AE52